MRTPGPHHALSILMSGFLLILFSCIPNTSYVDDAVFSDIQTISSTSIVDASIISFSPATGVYFPTDSVTTQLTLRNTGSQKWTFWIGASVQDKGGSWFDVPSHAVTLLPGQLSPTQKMAWIVPSEGQLLSGDYNIRVAVWKYQPEDIQALPIRLSWKEKKSSFTAFNFIDNFDSFNTARWTKPRHKTPGGLGWFLPDNAFISDGQLVLRLQANTRNGGEIQSTASSVFTYGTFGAKIKCPALPGTITTLFTYQGVDYGDEIDIEIWNDGSKQVGFTVWKYETSSITKKSVYNRTIQLDFDPAGGFHEYRIDFYPDRICWLIDGSILDKFTRQSDFPTHSMFLMVNTWWPNWPGWNIYKPVTTDRLAYFDGIQH